MSILEWVLIGIAVVIVILAIVFLIGFFRLMYLSIPFDEWLEMRKKTESKKKRGKRE